MSKAGSFAFVAQESIRSAAEQVIRADCLPACLSSKLCGFFEVVVCGRAAAQFQRSAASLIMAVPKSTLLSLLIPLLCSPMMAQRKSSASGRVEQTKFNLEEPFRHPAKIPNAVLRLLRQQIAREQWCPQEEPDPDGGVASWFSASAVDLNGDHLPDFVVRSQKGCLSGADNDWFWVFSRKGRGYQLVLFNGAASVSILKTRAHGFRDIKTVWNNISTVYKFNGRAYKARG